jgi:2-methylcitrate dehydratase
MESSHLARGCIHGTFLASRGVTGPEYIIERTDGLAQALGQAIYLDWDAEKLDCFDRLDSVGMLELHKAHPFDPADIVSIEAAVFQDAYDFTGGGKFGPKTNVHTKEDADHSLPYLLAVAALDGDVQAALDRRADCETFRVCSSRSR